jgi:hypothetical protein
MAMWGRGCPLLAREADFRADVAGVVEADMMCGRKQKAESREQEQHSAEGEP